MTETSELRDRVEQQSWYHTIDLPGGVTTRGMYDVRGCVPHLPLPPSLDGKRCLDVGTCDGFWAFELERRGAAEVVAIDLADPSARDETFGTTSAEGSETRAVKTFRLAHEALGSKVQWRDLSVYDLSPEAVGTFDFVFIGSLLMHLRDPIGALHAVRSVTSGQLLSHDAVSFVLSVVAPRLPAARLRGNVQNEWWVPNIAGRVREIEAGGFTVLDRGGLTWMRMPRTKLGWKVLRRHPFANGLIVTKGVPHTWVLAEPS